MPPILVNPIPSPTLSWITLPKLNMEPKNAGFQVRNLLFQAAIFRFHLKLWEGISAANLTFRPAFQMELGRS